jgi:hypothetical protein
MDGFTVVSLFLLSSVALFVAGELLAATFSKSTQAARKTETVYQIGTQVVNS